jgi:hypothetical protein
VSLDEVHRREVQRRVLTYSVWRPAAKDTAAGIRQWWFGSEDVPYDLLEEVLAELATKGWMTVRRVAAGRRSDVYGVNADKIEAILSFLGDLPISIESSKSNTAMERKSNG